MMEFMKEETTMVSERRPVRCTIRQGPNAGMLDGTAGMIVTLDENGQSKFFFQGDKDQFPGLVAAVIVGAASNQSLPLAVHIATTRLLQHGLPIPPGWPVEEWGPPS